jgi:nucleotide-binding universal stress UspA family protein
VEITRTRTPKESNMDEKALKVLIAVDDTHESMDAVRAAYELFGSAPDYLVTSIGTLPATAYPTTPSGDMPLYIALDEMAEKVEQAVMATALQAAEHLEAEASIEVDTGPVGASICRIAEEAGASVIVIGSHDRSIWDRLFRPSAGKYVVDNAPCPVLVVR